MSKLVALNNNSKMLAQSVSFEEMFKLADVFVKSGRFASERDVTQALVKIQAGKELGLQPIQAMMNIHIIQGKVTLGASVIAGLIKSSGKYDYLVLENTNEKCSIQFYQINFDGSKTELGPPSDFTLEDAKAAGLLSKDNWKKFPRNMLFSRALTNGARWYTPDVFGGPVYVPDELDSSPAVTNNDSGSFDSIELMEWDDFVELVGKYVPGISQEEIKEALKSNGFSWIASSKRDMFDHIVSVFGGDDVIDGEMNEV